MKIVFFWTADFSANILDKLFHTQWMEIVWVVSQADKPVGRKKEILPTPVKQKALDFWIPVFQPETLKNNQEFYQILSEFQADFFVVVAYGKIIPLQILELPKYLSVNIHGSLLPLYRWASPIQAAIKNGDLKTWVTIMKMTAGMDEWDILSTLEVDIWHTTKTQDIFDFFSQNATQVLVDTLIKYQNGEIVWVPQDHWEATYCGKISKEDGQIDFLKQSGKEIFCTWKAYHIWPGIYSFYQWKKIQFTQIDFEENASCLENWFEVWDVVEYEDHWENHIAILTQDWLLILEKVKLEWKKEMDILPFVNGNKTFLEYNFVIQK